jgi:hypothetical protein
MRQILTPFLAFHWMAVFMLLAMASAVGSGGGILAAFDFMGVTPVASQLPFGLGGRAAVSISLAAVLVSCLAVTLERWVTTTFAAPDAAHIRAVACVMVVAAAHGSTLSRISGHPDVGFGGERP